MKTLIAAVIASAFSLGAVAQTSPAPMAAPAPMAKADAAAKPVDGGMTKPANKSMKKHAAKKSMKKKAAPAA